jgi:protoporphyrinogen IX oxidase
MSIETLSWLRVAHVFGFVVWIGGMLSCLSLLHVHTLVDGVARESLTRVEKSVAMLMDLGATVAIAAGLTMALESTPNAFKTGAWLHVKLTVVALGLLSAHGIVRARIKQFSRGQIKPLPRWLFTAVLAAVAVIIALGANPTLLRK